jgi:hypothetical protein
MKNSQFVGAINVYVGRVGEVVGHVLHGQVWPSERLDAD